MNIATTPLSETRPDRTGGLAAFVETCSWADVRGSFAPDCWLLALVDERCRWLETERRGHSRGAVLRNGGELPRVGELPADWIEPLIEDVQARYGGWRLAGDDDTPLIDRLDQHYGARQETKQREVAARRAHDDAEARRREDGAAEADRLVRANERALYGLDSDPG
jgi:hypothetical protein